MAQYRGSPLGIKIVVAFYHRFGYRAVKWIVWLVALFYAAASRKKRYELYSYYRAVGVPASFLSYLRHIYAFSLTIFDRFIAREGMQESTIKVERVNVEAFKELCGSGGIVVLSHHGNWAQSFKIFETFDITLNIVMAEAMDEELEGMEKIAEANRRINIISMKKGMQAIVDIANAIRNKEIVIMMVDRILRDDKTVEVDFFGQKALLNSGAFEVARMRNTPMIGLDIVREGDEKIKVICSELIASTTKEKSKIIPELAQQYANFLEGVVRDYPWQWFNFYDFWEVKSREQEE
jgi:predicted LPLAT superfamily acyltransferase